MSFKPEEQRTLLLGSDTKSEEGAKKNLEQRPGFLLLLTTEPETENKQESSSTESTSCCWRWTLGGVVTLVYAALSFLESNTFYSIYQEFSAGAECMFDFLSDIGASVEFKDDDDGLVRTLGLVAAGLLLVTVMVNFVLFHKFRREFPQLVGAIERHPSPIVWLFFGSFSILAWTNVEIMTSAFVLVKLALPTSLQMEADKAIRRLKTFALGSQFVEDLPQLTLQTWGVVRQVQRRGMASVSPLVSILQTLIMLFYKVVSNLASNVLSIKACNDSIEYAANVDNRSSFRIKGLGQWRRFAVIAAVIGLVTNMAFLMFCAPMLCKGEFDPYHSVDHNVTVNYTFLPKKHVSSWSMFGPTITSYYEGSIRVALADCDSDSATYWGARDFYISSGVRIVIVVSYIISIAVILWRLLWLRDRLWHVLPSLDVFGFTIVLASVHPDALRVADEHVWERDAVLEPTRSFLLFLAFFRTAVMGCFSAYGLYLDDYKFPISNWNCIWAVVINGLCFLALVTAWLEDKDEVQEVKCHECNGKMKEPPQSLAKCSKTPCDAVAKCSCEGCETGGCNYHLCEQHYLSQQADIEKAKQEKAGLIVTAQDVEDWDYLTQITVDIDSMIMGADEGKEDQPATEADSFRQRFRQAPFKEQDMEKLYLEKLGENGEMTNYHVEKFKMLEVAFLLRDVIDSETKDVARSLETKFELTEEFKEEPRNQRYAVLMAKYLRWVEDTHLRDWRKKMQEEAEDMDSEARPEFKMVSEAFMDWLKKLKKNFLPELDKLWFGQLPAESTATLKQQQSGFKNLIRVLAVFDIVLDNVPEASFKDAANVVAKMRDLLDKVTLEVWRAFKDKDLEDSLKMLMAMKNEDEQVVLSPIKKIIKLFELGKEWYDRHEDKDLSLLSFLKVECKEFDGCRWVEDAKNDLQKAKGQWRLDKSLTMRSNMGSVDLKDELIRCVISNCSDNLQICGAKKVTGDNNPLRLCGEKVVEIVSATCADGKTVNGWFQIKEALEVWQKDKGKEPLKLEIKIKDRPSKSSSSQGEKDVVFKSDGFDTCLEEETTLVAVAAKKGDEQSKPDIHKPCTVKGCTESAEVHYCKGCHGKKVSTPKSSFGGCCQVSVSNDEDIVPLSGVHALALKDG